MKEQDAAEAAVLLNGLAEILKERAAIKDEWPHAPAIVPAEIFLPGPVWLDVMGYAGMMVKRRLEELGVTIDAGDPT